MEILARYRPYEPESIQLINAAKEIHAGARSNALKLLKTTRKAAASYKKKLYQRTKLEAYGEGYKAGLEAAQREHLDLHERFKIILEETKGECVELVCKLAKEVLQEELKTQTSSIYKRVVKLIDLMPHARPLRIMVARPHLEKIKKDLKQMFPTHKFSVEGVDELSPGNAIVMTTAGSIELNWDNHFRLLQEKLQNRR